VRIQSGHMHVIHNYMERIILLYMQRVSLVFQTRTRLITKAFCSNTIYTYPIKRSTWIKRPYTMKYIHIVKCYICR